MSTTKDSTTERKAMLTQVCDAENYLPIITACLDEAQTKKLKPRHMANFMALSAELFISNYAMIADAFERNNGLEIGFKAKLAQEKDNVEIQFKPVDMFKDSASAMLPDEDQAEFAFAKKSGNGIKAKAAPVVDAVVVPMALPAPARVLQLPAPIDVTDTDAGNFEELNQDGIDNALLRLEAGPKNKRKALLDGWLVTHGERNFLKLARCYKGWREPDPHLLKIILQKAREIDPTGDY